MFLLTLFDDHTEPFDAINSQCTSTDLMLSTFQLFGIFFNQVKLGWIALFRFFFSFCDAVSSLSMWMLLDLDCKLISGWVLNWGMSHSLISQRMQKPWDKTSVLMWVTARLFNKKLQIAIVCDNNVVFQVTLRWSLLFVKQYHFDKIKVKAAYVIFRHSQQYLWETQFCIKQLILLI